MAKVPCNSWSILPAGCLFNDKTKVTMEEVMKEWDSGTIVVCKKPNGHFGFIAGGYGDYAKIGSSQMCHHDQTCAKLGYWEIVAQVKYKKVDGVTVTEVEGSIEGVKKATIHVFK
jgi:hypothetical protein